MVDKISLVQARHALTVLRIASASDGKTALRLIEGLTRDFPISDASADAAEAHLSAIATYEKLAAALRDAARDTASHWRAAQTATDRWTVMVER